MASVLVVSPHFPPADTPDVQRLRLCLPHFSEHGLTPIVLTVEPEFIDVPKDNDLLGLLPEDLAIHRVKAFKSSSLVSAIGLRAFLQLYRKGAALIRAEQIDLVFISTTAFPVMVLGVFWKFLFGIGFVIDMQDPWATYPEASRKYFRKGVKASLARFMHSVGEYLTMKKVDGIVSVNESYLDLLEARYKHLTKHKLVQPFPYSRREIKWLDHQQLCDPADGQSLRLVAMGRIANAMRSQTEFLFRSLQGSESLVIEFVGTSYNGESVGLQSISRKLGCGLEVREQPERESYLVALQQICSADVLLLLGSADHSYLPSKIQPYLASNRPILLIADKDSLVYRQLENVPGVLAVDSNGEPRELIEDIFNLQKSNFDAAGREALLLEAGTATAELADFLRRLVP